MTDSEAAIIAYNVASKRHGDRMAEVLRSGSVPSADDECKRLAKLTRDAWLKLPPVARAAVSDPGGYYL